MSHREYLGDIISGSNGEFTYVNVDINPGIKQSFPWLCNVARNFDLYKFKSLRYEFISTSGNAITSVNTALGQVMMTAQYDSGNDSFEDIRSQLTYSGTRSFKPSETTSFIVDVKNQD